MNLKLVSFKTAVLAKKCEFENKTSHKLSRNYYNHLGELNGDVTEYIKEYVKNKNTTKFNTIDAPEQELLKMWLRKKHNIFVEVSPTFSSGEKKPNNYDVLAFGKHLELRFDTYELALESALQYGLNLIS